MTLFNSYVTYTDFQRYYRDDGVADTADDSVIDAVLNGASRWMEQETRGRRFYPRIETRYYSIPSTNGGWRKYRTLELDDDLLSLTTLTNGDDTTVSATNYYTTPRNAFPKRAVVLTETSGIAWQYSSAGNSEYVIDVAGIWGFHADYTNAYYTITTLSAAITTTTATSISLTSGTNVFNGHIARIDSEWLAIDASGGSTVRRGINGSTAATHANGASVELWTPVADVVEAVKQIALNAYRRFGQNTGGAVTLTAAGVVITPQDVGKYAQSVIETRRSYIL